MKHLIRTLGIASALVITLWIGGCASTLQFTADTLGVDVISESVQTKAYKAASVSFTAWEGVQRAIEIYGHLPPCQTGGPLVCRSAKAWAKIRTIEAQTSATLLAAKPLIEAGSNDVDLLMSLPAAVYDAQAAFLAAKSEPQP